MTKEPWRPLTARWIETVRELRGENINKFLDSINHELGWKRMPPMSVDRLRKLRKGIEYTKVHEWRAILNLVPKEPPEPGK